MRFEYLFLVAFFGVLANLIWKYLRHGRSLAGAILGGRIHQKVGEVALARSVGISQVIRVLEMESPEGERFVGLSVISKAPLAVSMAPYRLSRAQTQELIWLLQRASEGSAAPNTGLQGMPVVPYPRSPV